MRPVIWLAFVLSACSSSSEPGKATGAAAASPSGFDCYTRHPGGYAWRECAPRLTNCERFGCFQRPTAYCYPYLMPSADDTNETLTMCAATLKECEEWNDYRKRATDRVLAPCVESKPDEYIEAKE